MLTSWYFLMLCRVCRSDFEGNDSKDAVKSGTTKGVVSAVYDTSKFLELIENRCPSYVIVTAKLRGEMRLCVLVLKELAKEVTDVHIAAENTGIGSVLANKVYSFYPIPKSCMVCLLLMKITTSSLPLLLRRVE